MDPDRTVIISKLKTHGLSPTKYRSEVLFYLATYKSHPATPEIWHFLKKKYPFVSRATVYNILKSFFEKGLVSALKPDGRIIHYDANTTDHYHFYCHTCGRVTDVREEVLPGLDMIEKVDGNIINSVVVFFNGICSHCQIKTGTT